MHQVTQMHGHGQAEYILAMLLNMPPCVPNWKIVLAEQSTVHANHGEHIKPAHHVNAAAPFASLSHPPHISCFTLPRQIM